MATGDSTPSPDSIQTPADRVPTTVVQFDPSDYILKSPRADQSQPSAQLDSPKDSASAGEIAGIFAKSLAYSAIQTPIDGVTQLANRVAQPVFGPQTVPRFQLLEAPAPTEFGSAEWTARLAGGGIGTILPFYLGGKAAVRGMQTASTVPHLGPLITKSGILKSNSIAQLAFKGAVYEGIFHPVNETDNFWAQRGINFAAGGLAFMAMGKASEMMRTSKLGERVLNSSVRGVPLTGELGFDAVSGATAGVSDTLIRAGLNGEKVDARSLTESAGEYALLSAFLRLGRLPVERAMKEKPPGAQEPGKSEPVETKAQTEATDPLNLRPRLPFDKPFSVRQAVRKNGETVEVIGMEKNGKRAYIYRDTPERPDAPRRTMTAEEFESARFDRLSHKGQDYVVDKKGQAYTVQQINGSYELILSDRIILERLNEVQVPWPPIQTNEQYKTRQVIHLNQMLTAWMNRF